MYIHYFQPSGRKYPFDFYQAKLVFLSGHPYGPPSPPYVIIVKKKNNTKPFYKTLSKAQTNPSAKK